MTDDERFRQDEELLRRILREEADRVLPSVDALARIRRRTVRLPLWRRPVVLGLAAASLTAAVLIGGSVVWLAGPSEDTAATGTDATPFPDVTPTAPTTVAPTEDPSRTEPPESPAESPQPTESEPPARDTVPVYFVTRQGDRLAREFQTVPAPDGPLVAAVTTMIGNNAVDPDYQSLWLSDTQVRDVEVNDDVIEVDFTGETDYTGVTDEVANLAVQQLVYTVTAAASDARLGSAGRVQVLVDGEPPSQMWGQLDLSRPVQRADPLNTRLLVQINDPAHGAVLGRSVTVRGEALATFEGQVNWEIRDDAGNVVQEDFLTLETGVFRPFEFSVDLDSGSYTVVVFQPDPSGGAEGGGPIEDTKGFTVR
ncbi:MAG: GerMN domain-containing protein [Jiangellaceae bacterium]|nr:GerMN domain-containing protein [Jiangellaceae bacterium]